MANLRKAKIGQVYLYSNDKYNDGWNGLRVRMISHDEMEIVGPVVGLKIGMKLTIEPVIDLDYWQLTKESKFKQLMELYDKSRTGV